MHEVLEVLITQFLPRVDNSVHVGLHQFGDDIDVFEAGRSGGLEDIDHVDYVLLVEELEKLDFTDDTLGVDEVFEGFGDFFDGDFATALMVIGRAHHSISAVTDLLDVFVLRVDVESSS